MKIIDENGAAIENPDLTLGYLVDDTEPVEHPAVEGVEEVSHYETVTEYPGGGRDVRKVIDVPACLRRPHGPNRCRCRDTSAIPEEELAAREKRAPAGRGSSPSARDDCQPDLPADRPAAGPV